jgi:hypothetical protein
MSPFSIRSNPSGMPAKPLGKTSYRIGYQQASSEFARHTGNVKRRTLIAPSCNSPLIFLYSNSSSLLLSGSSLKTTTWIIFTVFPGIFSLTASGRTVTSCPSDGASRSYAVCCVSGSEIASKTNVIGRPPVISDISAEIAGKWRLRSMTCVAPIDLRAWVCLMELVVMMFEKPASLENWITGC